MWKMCVGLRSLRGTKRGSSKAVNAAIESSSRKEQAEAKNASSWPSLPSSGNVKAYACSQLMFVSERCFLCFARSKHHDRTLLHTTSDPMPAHSSLRACAQMARGVLPGPLQAATARARPRQVGAGCMQGVKHHLVLIKLRLILPHAQREVKTCEREACVQPRNMHAQLQKSAKLAGLRGRSHFQHQAFLQQASLQRAFLHARPPVHCAEEPRLQRDHLSQHCRRSRLSNALAAASCRGHSAQTPRLAIPAGVFH